MNNDNDDDSSVGEDVDEYNGYLAGDVVEVKQDICTIVQQFRIMCLYNKKGECYFVGHALVRPWLGVIKDFLSDKDRAYIYEYWETEEAVEMKASCILREVACCEMQIDKPTLRGIKESGVFDKKQLAEGCIYVSRFFDGTENMYNIVNSAFALRWYHFSDVCDNYLDEDIVNGIWMVIKKVLFDPFVASTTQSKAYVTTSVSSTGRIRRGKSVEMVNSELWDFLLRNREISSATELVELLRQKSMERITRTNVMFYPVMTIPFIMSEIRNFVKSIHKPAKESSIPKLSDVEDKLKSTHVDEAEDETKSGGKVSSASVSSDSEEVEDIGRTIDGEEAMEVEKEESETTMRKMYAPEAFAYLEKMAKRVKNFYASVNLIGGAAIGEKADDDDDHDDENKESSELKKPKKRKKKTNDQKTMSLFEIEAEVDGSDSSGAENDEDEVGSLVDFVVDKDPDEEEDEVGEIIEKVMNRKRAASDDEKSMEVQGQEKVIKSNVVELVSDTEEEMDENVTKPKTLQKKKVIEDDDNEKTEISAEEQKVEDVNDVDAQSDDSGTETDDEVSTKENKQSKGEKKTTVDSSEEESLPSELGGEIVDEDEESENDHDSESSVSEKYKGESDEEDHMLEAE